MDLRSGKLFMEKYILEFSKGRNSGKILSFFKALKNKDWEILFLVTRKGFWVYQLLSNSFEEIRLENRNVYSDRYLMKALDRTFIKGKKIYLVDDTMSSGYNLFRYFCILIKEGADKVIPMVYALNTEFPRETMWKKMDSIFFDVYGISDKSDDKNKKKAEELRQEFMKCLRCYQYLAPKNISALCIEETELFQRMLCPLAIDLPMLVAKSENGSILKDFFVLSRNKFQSLRSETDNWQYITNVYGGNIQNNQKYQFESKLDIPIQCNYFEYHNDDIEKLRDYFLQNLVVKCKFNEDEDGRYHVIFTPFAIVRSFQKIDLYNIFTIIFGNTAYGRRVFQALEHDNSEFVWTAVLRSVIFALSLYVGNKFKDLLQSVGILEVGYDWNLIEKNSEKIFIDTMRELSIDDLVIRNILNYYIRIDNKERVQIYNTGVQEYFADFAYEEIRLLVTQNNQKQNSIISLEEIEEKLAATYLFFNAEEQRRKITDLILIMLEISVVSNCVQVLDGEVRRGFKHGENSELLLSKTATLSYACAEVLYISCGKSDYKTYFDEYNSKMQDFFEKNKYFEGEYSKSQYDRNMEEYKIIPEEDLHLKIMGKKFLLEDMEESLQIAHEYAIDVIDTLIRGRDNNVRC